nr:DUF2971 domain-containing protein [uncultured Prevotella sp.]
MDTFYSMIEHSLYPKGDDVVPTHLIMWAGHYSYQNDPTECRLYFKGIEKAIQDYDNETSCNLMEKYNKYTSDPKKDLGIYLISFSEQEDDLTMWRGYGQNGDGISLGFNFDYLPGPQLMHLYDKKDPEANSHQLDDRLINRTDYPEECIYTEPNNIKIENEVYHKTLRILQEEDNEWKDIILSLINSKEAPKYKHIKYAAEKEHRIIKKKIISKFRIGRNGLPIPYIEVGIPLNCLQKIIIGPCLDSSEAITRIKKFLMTKGVDIENIEIITSQIPYRNRI